MAWVKFRKNMDNRDDLVREIEKERAKGNPKFPKLVAAALQKRRAARARP